MIVELHILQHFAPSNLNRDDTGAPKDCLFGGFRRARISSQCIKRAIRMYFQERAVLDAQERAIRTKRLIGTLAERLAAQGRDRAEADRVARRLLESVGVHSMADQPEKTEYLLFVGQAEIDRLVAVAERYWDDLVVADPAPDDTKRRSRREQKKAAKATVPSAVKDEVARILHPPVRAVDLALFGRMIADLPLGRVDAASQVAHAISTHQVSVEFDYYTAVDDLPQETTGADMIGTVEFNSACYYRYANVDLRQFLRNLDGDRDLARKGLAAFLEAAILAIPTGKQNSFAAQNPPSFVATVVRQHGLWSLVNAFVRPVRPSDRRDLVQESISALDRYWGELTRMYGTDALEAVYVATHEPKEVQKLLAFPKAEMVNVKDLVVRTVQRALAESPGEGS
jgi:CRISPR system Cascade subunit CasC